MRFGIKEDEKQSEQFYKNFKEFSAKLKEDFGEFGKIELLFG